MQYAVMEEGLSITSYQGDEGWMTQHRLSDEKKRYQIHSASTWSDFVVGPLRKKLRLHRLVLRSWNITTTALRDRPESGPTPTNSVLVCIRTNQNDPKDEDYTVSYSTVLVSRYPILGIVVAQSCVYDGGEDSLEESAAAAAASSVSVTNVVETGCHPTHGFRQGIGPKWRIVD